MKNSFIKYSIITVLTVLLSSGAGSDAKIFSKDVKNTVASDKIKAQQQSVIQNVKNKNSKYDESDMVMTSPIPYEGILSQASYKISALNPKVNSSASGGFYPGGRGANQLVLYTQKSGLRTGTNEFGAEAIVVDNTVVQISGADSIIPKGGIVISGHGRAKSWMNENLTVGSKIYIDYENMILTTYLTNDSFIFATKEKIKEIDMVMRYYKDNDIYYDDSIAHEYVTKALDNLRRANRHPNDTQKYSSMAINAANKAMQYALPYYQEEFKGVWLRPKEKSPEEIGKTLDKIKKYGIETVFLETYYQGKTIFPSETLERYGVQPQRSEFVNVGFDPLQVWIEEAHKRNLKIYIWFQTFYAGNENPMSNPQNVVNVYPQWANVTKLKYNSPTPVASISEHNGYFLDPANPDVQTYLLCLLEEIITKYKPDGINLDYIRYPQSISSKFAGYEMSNWGYTEYARNEYKSLMNVDPIDIKAGTANWGAWSRYRQNKITSFVFKTKQLTSKYKIPLTAVIFPDRINSKESKMQDWKPWSEHNYVDAFTALILTCDKDTASYLINDIKSNSRPNTKIYAGLFVAFMNGNPDDLLRQLHESRKLKASGIVLFDYAHLDSKYTDVLLTNAFKPSAPAQTTLSRKKEIEIKPIIKKEEQIIVKPKRKWFKKNKKQEVTATSSSNKKTEQTKKQDENIKTISDVTPKEKTIKNKHNEINSLPDATNVLLLK